MNLGGIGAPGTTVPRPAKMASHAPDVAVAPGVSPPADGRGAAGRGDLQRKQFHQKSKFWGDRVDFFFVAGTDLPSPRRPPPNARRYPTAARTVRYWLIWSMAASRSVWMFCRHCSRASRLRRSWPSMARSSSSVKPAKPAGGTGIGGTPAGRRAVRAAAAVRGEPQKPSPVSPKSGGHGVPSHGGGKGRPGTGPGAAVASDPAAAVSLGLAAVAREMTLRAAAGGGSRVSAGVWGQNSPDVAAGAAFSAPLGGWTPGTGGKGPTGGQKGNIPGGKGGRSPWGTAEGEDRGENPPPTPKCPSPPPAGTRRVAGLVPRHRAGGTFRGNAASRAEAPPPARIRAPAPRLWAFAPPAPRRPFCGRGDSQLGGCGTWGAGGGGGACSGGSGGGCGGREARRTSMRQVGHVCWRWNHDRRQLGRRRVALNHAARCRRRRPLPPKPPKRRGGGAPAPFLAHLVWKMWLHGRRLAPVTISSRQMMQTLSTACSSSGVASG